MQRCKATVRLAGDMRNAVVKSGVSPAEVMVLQHIHGPDSVVDIRVTGNDRGNPQRHHGELARLRNTYREKAVAAVFPGVKPTLPETFEEAGIDTTGADELEDEPDRKPAKKAAKKRARKQDTDIGPANVTADDLADDDANPADEQE